MSSNSHSPNWKWGPIDCSQNIPAVLNNPKKGKQKDFFTKSWGDSFTETALIPSSPHLCELPSNCFDAYLRKLLKYHKIVHNGFVTSQRQGSEPCIGNSSLTSIPKIFMDPNFDLTNSNTFEIVFPTLLSSRMNDLKKEELQENQKEIQERLGSILDVIEMNIAIQVAQKSHHFFTVMTYQEALMTQLRCLVKCVKTLRSRLKDITFGNKESLRLLAYIRKINNVHRLVDKLSLMSSVHQTQQTIQILLSHSEFSKALDLIGNRKRLLISNLKDVIAFRHLSSQLEEIESAIQKMLLVDFETQLAPFLIQETLQIKLSSYKMSDLTPSLENVDEEQLTSVIHGLLRKNSFTFLEILDNQSNTAVMNTIENIITRLLPTNCENDSPFLVLEFAKMASCEDWVNFFDILLGSLMLLLNRINSLHGIVKRAISTVNEEKESSNRNISPKQIKALQTSNQELMSNVWDKVYETCSTFLYKRSQFHELINSSELSNLEKLFTSLSHENQKMTGGNNSHTLDVSLQSQSLLFIDTYFKRKRIKISSCLRDEKWSGFHELSFDFTEKISKIESFKSFFSSFTLSNGLGNRKPLRGLLVSSGETFFVLETCLVFIVHLSKFIHLSTILPKSMDQIGAKINEEINFFNSQVCQFILGTGAVLNGNLKTINTRSLALTSRSIQLLIAIFPILISHFNTGETKQKLSKSTAILLSHSEELWNKTLAILSETLSKDFSDWKYEAHVSVPSKSFQKIVYHIKSVHDNIVDIWPTNDVHKFICQVHTQFLRDIKTKILGNDYKSPSLDKVSRTLLYELIFYGQSLIQITNALPEKALTNETFEKLWSH